MASEDFIICVLMDTPCYVCDEEKIEANLKCLAQIRQRTGCKVLQALKAFSIYHFFPLAAQYLDGISASSLYEARLGYDYFKKEVHIYSPAYDTESFQALCGYASHIVFNSFSQWQRFKPLVPASAHIEFGIRINPQHSETQYPIYDPCYQHSRLGVTKPQFQSELLEGIHGLHFHTLCEKNVDALERTLVAVEQKFGSYFQQMRWINFGGGHHISHPDYDRDRLCELIINFQKKYDLQVILEPGSTIALDAGVLISEVKDIITNEIQIAVLDTSAAAHMPDVLEMPYRPEVIGAAKPNEKPYTYRLTGNTCLAGDIIGDYSFDTPLQIGQRLVFTDMAQYTMVKNNTFNGVRLPNIAVWTQDHQLQIIRKFDYSDFKSRLGC